MIQNLVTYQYGKDTKGLDLHVLAVKMQAICSFVTGVCGGGSGEIGVHHQVNEHSECTCGCKSYCDHTLDCWQCLCGKSTQWHKDQMLPIIEKFLNGEKI